MAYIRLATSRLGGIGRSKVQSLQDHDMKPTSFRVRTLMIAVALAAGICALLVAALRSLHIHDFYFTFGSPR